jgi:hypothetical protein
LDMQVLLQLARQLANVLGVGAYASTTLVTMATFSRTIGIVPGLGLGRRRSRTRRSRKESIGSGWGGCSGGGRSCCCNGSVGHRESQRRGTVDQNPIEAVERAISGCVQIGINGRRILGVTSHDRCTNHFDEEIVGDGLA